MTEQKRFQPLLEALRCPKQTMIGMPLKQETEHRTQHPQGPGQMTVNYIVNYHFLSFEGSKSSAQQLEVKIILISTYVAHFVLGIAISPLLEVI